MVVQVFKFPPYGGTDGKPVLVLGTRFQPGSDDKHYCKPTAVAVSKDTNSFFVSDGYCNSRIIKYGVTEEPGGKHQVRHQFSFSNVNISCFARQVTKLLEWGKGAGPFTVTKHPASFNIPHGLALVEERDELCVADRENGRVQCFTTAGQFTRSLQPEQFGSRIFSVAATPANGQLQSWRTGEVQNPHYS